MAVLAGPVVLAELGWMTMGMVDTLMVGRLSAEAIGAVGLGSSIFMAIGVFAMGLLLGLDTLVSHAWGAGRIDECHRWLLHGVVAAAVLTLPVTGVLLAVLQTLGGWGMDPGVLRLTEPYLAIVTWSVLPLLLYAAFRRYLQGMGAVRPVMFALLAANLINVLANWILIYGRLGAPALGVSGAGWATVLSRMMMAAFLFGAIVWRERGLRGFRDARLTISRAWMHRLVQLGLPAAVQITLEVGVFAAASALAGRLAPASLAAHQIALNLAGFTFMVPLGVASAGAVRVGHAIGRRDGAGAVLAGWTALLLGSFFMAVAALVFVAIPGRLISAFTSEPEVLRIGAALLVVAAVFQLFDGLQGVGTGVLRGLGDTRSPMLWNLGAYWLVGLPVAYWLAFEVELGVIGLWWGLSAGLIICGVALLVTWARRSAAVLALLSAGGDMAEQQEPPRPHGDPLADEVTGTDRETGMRDSGAERPGRGNAARDADAGNEAGDAAASRPDRGGRVE